MGMETILDEVVSVAIILFLASSVFSYAAIRSAKKSDLYEKIADGIFLGGLVLLTLISVIIVFEIV